MPFQSIIEIDVNDAAFRAFEAKYDAFAKALKEAHPRLDLGTDATLAGLDAILQQVTRIASAIDRATFAQQRFRSATNDTARALERSQPSSRASSGFQRLHGMLPAPLREPARMAGSGLSKLDETITGGALLKLAGPIGIATGALAALAAAGVGTAEMLGRLSRSGLDLIGHAQSLGVRATTLQGFLAATQGQPTNLTGIQNAQHNLSQLVNLSIASGQSIHEVMTEKTTDLNTAILQHTRQYVRANRNNPAALMTNNPVFAAMVQAVGSVGGALQVGNESQAQFNTVLSGRKLGRKLAAAGGIGANAGAKAQQAASTLALAHARLSEAALRDLLPAAVTAAKLENATFAAAAKGMDGLTHITQDVIAEFSKLVRVLRGVVATDVHNAPGEAAAAAAQGRTLVHGLIDPITGTLHPTPLTAAQQKKWAAAEAAAGRVFGVPAGFLHAQQLAEGGGINNPLQFSTATALALGVNPSNANSAARGAARLDDQNRLALMRSAKFRALPSDQQNALVEAAYQSGAPIVMRQLASHRTFESLMADMASSHPNEFGDVYRFERAAGNSASSFYLVSLTDAIRQLIAELHRDHANPHNHKVFVASAADGQLEKQANAAGR